MTIEFMKRYPLKDLQAERNKQEGSQRGPMGHNHILRLDLNHLQRLRL
ncbi:hypothetical protein DSUL_60243 [Desulfovibrionales bacterium]